MITREDFKSYIKVQYEGKFNMLAPEAINLTGLSKDKYFEIIRNYSKYADEFNVEEIAEELGLVRK